MALQYIVYKGDMDGSMFCSVSHIRILEDVDLCTLVSNASLKHYDIRLMLVAGTRSPNSMSFGCVLIAVYETFAGFVSRARFEWQDQDATVSAEK